MYGQDGNFVAVVFLLMFVILLVCWAAIHIDGGDK